MQRTMGSVGASLGYLSIKQNDFPVVTERGNVTETGTSKVYHKPYVPVTSFNNLL
jgi:hypothetical protein